MPEWMNDSWPEGSGASTHLHAVPDTTACVNSDGKAAASANTAPCKSIGVQVNGILVQ